MRKEAGKGRKKEGGGKGIQKEKAEKE